LRVGSGKRTSFFLIVLFVFVGASNWAQSDTERPLRTVPLTEEFHIPSVRHSTYSPQTTPSLLTPSVLEQPLFLHYIAQYTNASGIAYLNSVLDRASLYLPFIKEEVKRRNLPPELAYLPVIESNFIITAKSKSGAVGLWQFMLNSISPFDIKVNDIID
jgi:membrane-bound lytic murein transglycosylase D